MRTLRFLLLANLLVWTFSRPGQGAAPVATFTYSPLAIRAGDTLTFNGSNVAAGTASVHVSVRSATGVRTVLGTIPVNGAGTFSAALTVPGGVAAGMYFVNIVDGAQRAVINRTGELSIVPPGTPWSSFSPLGAAPGESITVSATGFSSSSLSATVRLVNNLNQTTFLGTVPLSGGAFTQTFPIPAGQTSNAYSVNIKDSAGMQAFSTSGPLAVGTAPPSVGVGFYPVGVAVNPGTNRVYVPNSADNTVSVLDGATNTVIATVPVGSLPCAIAVNSRTNRIYVANTNDNSVSVIDGTSNTVLAAVPTGPGPCAVTLTPNNNRIFVGNYLNNTLTVIDGSLNTAVATIPLRGIPGGVGANPVTSMVYSANGFDNSISVIDGSTNTIVAIVPAGAVPDAIAVNPTNNRVYVANFMGRSLTIIDGNTNTALKTVQVGIGPDGVAVDPFSNKVYVANYMGNSVSVVDGNTGAVTATIPVGEVPDGIAVNPYTRLVYTPNSNSNSVSVIPE